MISVLRNILFFILIFSLIYVFLSKKYILEEDVLLRPVDSIISLGISNTREKDYILFLNESKKKKIFMSANIEKKSEMPIVNKEKLNRIKDNLRLVGIISEGYYKVIIEEIRTKKTFYIEEKEVFLEKIKVIKIGDSSVILNCFGEDFELYL